MASTIRALRKRVEYADISQVLEEITDSDVTIFSSEEDEDGIEPDSEQDGQLDHNSETNENGGTRTSGPKLLI
jgi:vacuolar-type H+-ATPase subunit E/Vma4